MEAFLNRVATIDAERHERHSDSAIGSIDEALAVVPGPGCEDVLSAASELAEDRWRILHRAFEFADDERTALVAEQAVILAEHGVSPGPELIVAGWRKAQALWFQCEVRDFVAKLGVEGALERALASFSRAWIRPAGSVGMWGAGFRRGELAVGLVEVGARAVHSSLGEVTRHRLRGSRPSAEISAALVDASRHAIPTVV